MLFKLKWGNCIWDDTIKSLKLCNILIDMLKLGVYHVHLITFSLTKCLIDCEKNVIIKASKRCRKNWSLKMLVTWALSSPNIWNSDLEIM